MTEKKKENKFIVINRKRFDELLEADERFNVGLAKRKIRKIEAAIEDFIFFYEYTTGKKMDQKYIVCNQDEPYAEKVWDLILGRLADTEDTGGEKIVFETVSEYIEHGFNTNEKNIREQLISMGWTPPPPVEQDNEAMEAAWETYLQNEDDWSGISQERIYNIIFNAGWKAACKWMGGK